MPRISRGFARLLPLLALAALLATGCDKKPGLRITGIEPKSGPYTGGTLVTVHGSGFQEGGVKGVKVYFGEKEATRVYIDGDTRIKVEPPGGEPDETVDVMFLFDDAKKLEYPKAFTYIDYSQHKMGADALIKPEDKKENKTGNQ
jgi:hypothetical protein